MNAVIHLQDYSIQRYPSILNKEQIRLFSPHTHCLLLFPSCLSSVLMPLSQGHPQFLPSWPRKGSASWWHQTVLQNRVSAGKNGLRLIFSLFDESVLCIILVLMVQAFRNGSWCSSILLVLLLVSHKTNTEHSGWIWPMARALSLDHIQNKIA